MKLSFKQASLSRLAWLGLIVALLALTFSAAGIAPTQVANVAAADAHTGVTIHTNGNLYVADTGNHRIQVFGDVPPDTGNNVYLPSIRGAPAPEPTGLVCNPSGGAGGLVAGTSTEFTFQGQPVAVSVSSSYTDKSPGYLTLFLHGDDGGYRASPVTEGGVAIGPQAPLAANGFYSWYAKPDERTAFLAALLAQIYSQYNLCRNVLFGGSVSGGSVFYDRNFYARLGHIYPAFWSINCGGGRPFGPSDVEKLQSLSQKPDIVARTEFAYTIGTLDFLFNSTKESAEYREPLGFAVKKDFLEGVGHCEYDDSKPRFRSRKTKYKE